MVRLTVRLCRGDPISKAQIMRDCDVSIATAKRYMAELTRLLPVIARTAATGRVEYFIPPFLRQTGNPPLGKRAA